jgi:polyisoprenoid-binding protein YceI
MHAMSKWMLVAALSIVGAASPAAGQITLQSLVRAPRRVPNAVVAEGKLSFDGRANVGDFTGTTTAVRGELAGGEDITLVRGWVEAPVSTLVTGNGKRDRDLNRSMESDKYPAIRFELSGVTRRNESGDTTQVDLQGRFLIHGVEREVTIPAVVVLADDVIRLRADTPLDLKDYRIGGLSKAFGVLRMYHDILVHIDVTFAPGTAGSTAQVKS